MPGKGFSLKFDLEASDLAVVAIAALLLVAFLARSRAVSESWTSFWQNFPPVGGLYGGGIGQGIFGEGGGGGPPSLPGSPRLK